MKYFIANWKANKNLEEAIEWAQNFVQRISNNTEHKIIVCPPFPFLQSLTEVFKDTPVSVGAQDSSSFEKGSYTGEVTALSLQGVAKYVILGHSERRKYFDETEEVLEKKIAICKQHGLKTILCVRGSGDTVYPDADIIAYEPVEAIGSGQNAPVDDVVKMKEDLGLSGQAFLYGGSVNKNTGAPYVTHPEIDGVLVGGASLDPVEFFELIKTAA